MKKYTVISILCLALAGCDQTPATPLAHALAAFRAADHDEFMMARQEAEKQKKEDAIPSGGDTCLITPGDFALYTAVDIINKLDQSDLFKVSEEERLAYALHVAGKHATAKPGSFLSQAHLFSGGFDSATCARQQEAFQKRMGTVGAFWHEDDEARSEVLKNWVSDMEDKHGDRFDADMRSAVNHLSVVGYTAEWPPQVALAGEEPLPGFEAKPMPSFADQQRN